MKTVVFEVLSVVGWVEVEVIVGNEGRTAPPTSSSVPSGHLTDDFGICCVTEVNGVSTVELVLELIAEPDDDMTLERPFEVIIKLSSHQGGKHRDMCALTITTAISIHLETHLVPLWVGVEWWGEPVVTV